MTCLFVFFWVWHLSVYFSESVSNFLSELLSGIRGLEVVVTDVLEVEVTNDEPSGHHMVLVDVLYKRLDSCFLDEFLLVE